MEEFLSPDDTFGALVAWKKKKVTPTEIHDKIEKKYFLLRKKLIYKMAVQFTGEITWDILSDDERAEQLEWVNFKLIFKIFL